MRRFLPLLLAPVICLSLHGASQAAPMIGIATGGFYTPNLKNDLIAGGATVTEFSSYTAASLAPYNAVIVYGNMSTVDMAALQTYVQNGGTLIETPWFWRNYNGLVPSALAIFSQPDNAEFSISYPGVNVVAPGDPLLSGVTFPPGTGGFNIGRTQGNTFLAGVTPVANWADGTAFIGHKSFGAGQVIGINMHVITSDTAYQVIDQPFATRLFLNAAGAQAVVPEPATLTALGLMGAAGFGYVRRRLKKPAVVA